MENNMEDPTLKLADDNFKNWNEALEKREARGVAKKYSESGELFGTVSARIRQGEKEIEEYFKHFLKIDPSGKVVKRETINISDDVFLDGGLYNFDVVKGGEKQTIEAMFTYVWQKDKNGDWKIKHHHSAVKNGSNESATKQNEMLDMSGSNIEWGINEEIGNGITLRTGFLRSENEIIRFTYLIKKNSDNTEEVIYRQLSECPKNSGV